MNALSIFLLLAPLASLAQCDPLYGAAAPGSLEYTLNPFKNRTKSPTAGQIKHAVSLAELLAPGNDTNRFSNTDAVVIEGYVIGATLEGPESCNCNKTDRADRDYHIAIAKKKTEKDEARMMVVEVTPRVRAAMGWSEAEITGLKRHKVKFTGWLFFDKKHRSSAKNTHTGIGKIHRATAWEVHPVMRFEVLD